MYIFCIPSLHVLWHVTLCRCILCACIHTGAWFAACCWLMVTSIAAVQPVGTRWHVGVGIVHTHHAVYEVIVV